MWGSQWYLWKCFIKTEMLYNYEALYVFYNTQHGYDTEDTLKIWYLACVCVCGLTDLWKLNLRMIFYINLIFYSKPEGGVQVYKSEYKSGYWLEFKRQEKLGIGYKLLNSLILETSALSRSWVCHLNNRNKGNQDTLLLVFACLPVAFWETRTFFLDYKGILTGTKGRMGGQS